MSEPTDLPKPLSNLLRHAPPQRPRSGMRILYLCHRVPYPPDKGDRIRAFHQIQGLSRRHEVYLLSLSDGPVPDLQPLQELCARVEVFPIQRSAAYLRAALGVLRPRPLTLSFFESAELRRRVEELARSERFDAVIAYSSSMAPYAELLSGVPALLDMVDVDSAKWDQYARHAARPLRPVYALEARRLQAYEAKVASRFECVVLATGNEVQLLKSFAPMAQASGIPNGIDLDFFQPLDLPKADSPTLIFTGQMDYFANVDGVVRFVGEVFPRLRRRFSDLQLLIVGRSPVKAVRELADLDGVHVTGAVGDVRPFLSRSWVFVAPLRIAQGVQNKVLEAMASNLPVVCSERVFAGLAEGGFEDGRDLLVAEGPEAMEQAIAGLLDDAAQRERLAECARQRLPVAYRWAAHVERFEELLEAAVRQAAPAPPGTPEASRAEEPVAEGARSA